MSRKTHRVEDSRNNLPWLGTHHQQQLANTSLNHLRCGIRSGDYLAAWRAHIMPHDVRILVYREKSSNNRTI
jgi:hypothetical protein